MKIIITAGGTGGHIYPALAILNTFKKKCPNLDVLYIGTHNRMEKDLIPKRNIPYESLEIYGFSKKDLLLDCKNIFLIQKAKKKCLSIIRDFKPDIVLGIGGYVTYPVIWAAHKLGIKTFIHEQNSHPGKSNLALQKYADLIGISFTETKTYFNKSKGEVFYSGNPCGENALLLPPFTKKDFNLQDNKKLVVIVAGSLGSSSINAKMKDFLLNKDHTGYEIIYITGKNLYDSFIQDTSFPSHIKVLPYVDNLPSLLKITDLLITRAGASTIAEIISLKIPAIFIPSPYVANNHQYYNALEIQKQGGGDIILEKELTSVELETKIKKVLFDEQQYTKMKNSLQKMQCNASSDIIYEKIRELVG